MLRMQADGVLQHGRGDAMRRGLDRLQAEAAADAAAQDMEFLESEMIHQRQMISRISVPAVIRPDLRARPAGVALVHGNRGKTRRRQGLRPVHPGPRRPARRSRPHLDAGAQAARREQQDGKALAKGFVVNFTIGAGQHRHAHPPVCFAG
nr:hypothetical protein [uncultured Rhodopila sp.]